jgi:hypothetical protein
MKEKMEGWLAIDHSTLEYVEEKLGRTPNCSMLSAMHRFEREMDRWLKQLDEKEKVC